MRGSFREGAAESEDDDDSEVSDERLEDDEWELDDEHREFGGDGDGDGGGETASNRVSEGTEPKTSCCSGVR